MSFETNQVNKVDTIVKYSNVIFVDGTTRTTLKGVVGDYIEYPLNNKIKDESTQTMNVYSIIETYNPILYCFPEYDTNIEVIRYETQIPKYIEWTFSNQSFSFISKNNFTFSLKTNSGESIPIVSRKTLIENEDYEDYVYQYSIEINLPEGLITNNTVLDCKLTILKDGRSLDKIIADLNIQIFYSSSPGGI